MASMTQPRVDPPLQPGFTVWEVVLLRQAIRILARSPERGEIGNINFCSDRPPEGQLFSLQRSTSQWAHAVLEQSVPHLCCMRNQGATPRCRH